VTRSASLFWATVYWHASSETKCVAKAVAKQSEADETRPREYALLTWHAEVVEERQVFDAKSTPSSVQMIAVIDTNMAVNGMPPGLQPT